MKAKILITALLFLLVGQIMYGQSKKELSDQALKSWNGSTENELILQLGIPTANASDGAGGKILKYSITIGAGTSGVMVGNVYTESTSGGVEYYYQFYINTKGIVYANKASYTLGKKESKNIHKKVTVTPSATQSSAVKSKSERLREIKEMYEEKLITKDEYDKEKKKILDEK